MVRVNADEERVKFLEHRAQGRRDALRQKDRNARADAKKFNMGDGAQLAEQMLKFFIAEQERVTTAEQHVPDFRMSANVVDLFVELRVKIVAGGVADETRARAISAISGTTVGH